MYKKYAYIYSIEYKADHIMIYSEWIQFITRPQQTLNVNKHTACNQGGHSSVKKFKKMELVLENAEFHYFVMFVAFKPPGIGMNVNMKRVPNFSCM